jgi:hypothetical protein
LVDILTVVILVVDFVISIWNSYAAGFTIGLQRISKGPGYIKAIAGLALAMGLLGETYVLTVVLALVANAYGWVDVGSLNLLLAYNFLITGGLITVLGIGITAESLYVAYKRPGIWTIGGSVYNVFASIWNVFTYLRNFGTAMNIIKSEERQKGQGAVILLAITSVVIAVLLSYIAFHYGRAHASGQYTGRVKDEDL